MTASDWILYASGRKYITATAPIVYSPSLRIIRNSTFSSTATSDRFDYLAAGNPVLSTNGLALAAFTTAWSAL